MMGGAEYERNRRWYPASLNSRAPAAQSFNRQHQHQHSTYEDFLDLTNIGNVHNNVNPSGAQQRCVGDLHGDPAGAPADSYEEEPFTVAPNTGRNPDLLFNDGFGPEHLGVAAPLLFSPHFHSGGTSNIGLEDAPSLSTGNTGIPTTANGTSEAGRSSHPRHSFIGPSRPTQSASQPVVPSQQVDNYNVPNYGAPAVNTGATPLSWNATTTIPRLNGNGQGAQFQDVNAQVSFAPASNVGTGGHSDYTGIDAPHGQPMTYINPGILTAMNGAVSSDVAYSDGAIDNLDDLGLFQLPPANNFKSHLDKATFENYGNEDLLRGVGCAFNTPPNLSFYQTAQQTTPDGRHGQPNYTATGTPFGQQHWPLNSPASYQGDGTPTFTRVVQLPESQSCHTMAGAVDTTAEAIPATSFLATGPPSTRAEPRPTWQAAPMESQPLTQRDPQESQTRSTQPATMNTLPSCPLRAEVNKNEAVPKERGKRKKKFSQAKKDSVTKRKNGRTVCIRCRYSHVECKETLGQSCSYCERHDLLCATAHFCHLYRNYSILPLRNHEDGNENSAAMVSNDVDIATLKKGIDALDPEFNIRAISADRNLKVVLDMENLHRALCQGASESRSDSDTAPTNHSRSANLFKWAPCVKGSKTSQSIDILAKLYLVRSLVTFEYVTKANSESVREVQDYEHNGALDEVVRLLCRNLEIETWDVFHARIYNHKDMGKKKPKQKKSKTRKTRKPRARKPSPHRSHPPNVRSLASELLILLRALREYFRSLTRSATKLRVGELCKRLYGYFLSLQGKPPNFLGKDDLQRLCEDLEFGRNELPSDKPTRAFFRWIGASDRDVLWWEECMHGNMARLP